jgi:hypothetical protein
MPKQAGRPSGRILFAEGFEALLASRHLLKSTVATEAAVSAGFISDLLARRTGASDEVAERIAQALSVPVAALFPEMAGWVSPLPDRDRKRAA